MPEKEVLLTGDGVKRLEDELHFLKSVKRREVADRIRTAIDFGDISENSEYEEAKNEQAFVEGRIIKIEKMLRYARIIDTSELTPDTVGIGSTVLLRDQDTGDDIEYTIVGSAEADPAECKISNKSPVGKAILGKKVGSTVEIKVPAGTLRYSIMDIRC
ncbi:MAG: transcription elongation factor GreA [Syntrophaceticus sp.]|nr:transcription elongation factor GreA [Syntrophaceticus sp.]MDD3315024.1 transcription elongation factor GreA [Syntrophaceticus sp.]MDD4359684.1 transcription elongation factor GreA [Syntrophaceticus sp.]MDD4782966.1 transcription elongation factor GreA [Syntrophaceticus sp.]